MRREEKPTRWPWMVYCIYNMLNMFRALLCPSSGPWDYMCVITAYGVQCLVAGCRRSGAGQQAILPGSVIFHATIKHSVASRWFFFSTHMYEFTGKHTSRLLLLSLPSLLPQFLFMSYLKSEFISYASLSVEAQLYNKCMWIFREWSSYFNLYQHILHWHGLYQLASHYHTQYCVHIPRCVTAKTFRLWN